MLHDYALWQEFDSIRPLLPMAEKNLEFFAAHHTPEGLVAFPGWNNWTKWPGGDAIGWNFLDWHDSWFRGVPPGDCALNCLYLLALEKSAELEEMNQRPEAAARYRKRAETLAVTIRARYETPTGALADDEAKQYCSEHPQILSVLSAHLPDYPLDIPDATPAGICFSNYYLEAAYQLRDAKLFYRRLARWFVFNDQGLKTLPEEFTHPRSDCHAWSSHILYHYFASILGIRPRRAGSREWNLAPLFGDLEFAEGTMRHSRGPITVGWKKTAGYYELKYEFPDDAKIFVQNRPLPSSQGTLRFVHDAETKRWDLTSGYPGSVVR
ncbi:hypothetical protein SDC9_114271 [bioreactor metagenome]|uniref:Alpha-L-rhamnosidase C-terminal domain-containing protein n=1 Tax=bioreactor metagenome TaxID=1076179 RepID=A0A645BPJ0_9ZZZZ